MYNVLLEDMDCSELLYFLYIRILLSKHLALPKMKTRVPTISPLLDVVINIFYYFYTINSTLALSVSKKGIRIVRVNLTIDQFSIWTPIPRFSCSCSKVISVLSFCVDFLMYVSLAASLLHIRLAHFHRNV